MKVVKKVLFACLFASTCGYAQTSSQTIGQAPSPSTVDQVEHGGKHHRFRTANADQDPGTCVGPASFCTPYFGR